jgi:transcriptional regulator with XRE-family HTH domain
VLRDRLYKVIGQRIALARGGKFTQLELALRVGISRPAIANIERGEQQIYVHQLMSIADALEVPLDDLLPQHQFKPLRPANISVSGDRVNRAQERVIKELVSAITSATRKEKQK